jgi:hypothetical protein
MYCNYQNHVVIYWQGISFICLLGGNFNMEDTDEKEVEQKSDFYRKEIIRIIAETESVAVLEYLYYFIIGKVKAE